MNRELVEKAAKAQYENAPRDPYTTPWEMATPDEYSTWMSDTGAALNAVAGNIKAEALREAAEALETYDPDTAQWLKFRADQIEGKS